MTILFADVVDSTGLGERLDPEALSALMTKFFGCAEKAIESHGGVVEKFIGDAVMAVFGIPQAHEDDGLRAIRAGVELQQAVAAMNHERPDLQVAIRVAINSGEVLAASGGEGRSGVIGDAVNATARLEKLAPPGGILISSATHRLVRDSVTTRSIGRVEIRGKSEPLEAHLVMAVDPASGQPRNFEAPLVGRMRELNALQREYERAAQEKVCMLFTLLGPAGIGKSRLIAELIQTAAEPARVLTGRCLPYGDGITFWPVTEAISHAAQISDRDSQEDAIQRLVALVGGHEDDKLIANLVAQLMGLSEQTATREETFWAVRKVFEFLSDQTPLVLVFDDIHWAETALLDLIDHVVDHTAEAPIFVACLARPELLEHRPNWAGGKFNATTILLEPLKENEAVALFTGLLGETAEIERLIPRVLEASGGNPLFLEETVAMLVDDGAIENVDGRWRAHKDLDAISIPPTINALLTSRMDQLPTSERVTIEIASVMGKVVAPQAIRALATEVDVVAAIDSLSRKGLVKRDQEEFAGEQMYRFRHILIRDAAYQLIPKERRVGLHRGYADWLIEVLGERSTEYDEIIGYHYEQAHQLATSLGMATSDELARRATLSLASAGRRALGRSDLAAGVNLLTRAAAFDEADGDRSYLLLELGHALWEQGDYDLSERHFTEALDIAISNQDAIAEARAKLHLEEVHVHNRPQASTKDYRAAIERSIPELEQLNDHEGLAFAFRQLSYACDSLGDSTEAASALTKAVEHALAGGDERRAIGYRRAQIQSLSWGPTPVSDIEALTHAFLQWAEEIGDRRSMATAYGIQGPIEASKGNFDLARELVRKEIEIYDDLGLEIVRAWCVFEHVTVEKLAGTPERAEAELGKACEVMRRRRETAVLPTILGMMADVCADRGSTEQAEALVEEALTNAAQDDVLTLVKCDSALAKVRASQGREEDALALARRATEVSDTTEWLDWRAFTWIDRASVASAFGRQEEALEALTTARNLFKTKGMEHPAADTARLLTRLR